MRLFVLAAVLLSLAGVSFAGAPISVTACTQITTPGEYVLTQDLFGLRSMGYGYEGSECIIIGPEMGDAAPRATISLSGKSATASLLPPPGPIVLNCAGHTISGTYVDSSSLNGIVVNIPNVTVKNCIVSGYFKGIAVHSGSNKDGLSSPVR